ncbi:MAG: Hsp20/alpha crystallin family protein [Candidatus Bathyarchaeota archaeon]|nr:Hsp20/alpha crystallin family protein [Candidatus Bathyarchaeota archaeon]
MSFWDEWFKRYGKRSSIFGDFERFMEEMEKEMAEAFKSMEGRMPREMYRERRLPDGSIRREYGPFVYGYSVKIGPDGKPIIREFGNMKPGLKGEKGASLNLQDRREPLVDLIEDNGTIKVLAELPGVEKDDIKLSATSRGLTINVENVDRRYFKELEFPVEVDESTARSSYRNGVLEILFSKRSRDNRGKEIKVE